VAGPAVSVSDVDAARQLHTDVLGGVIHEYRLVA
jgi:hypothetical protein